MIIGVKISSLNENDLPLAISFVQANILMTPESIKQALYIKDFIFYSYSFDGAVLTGYPFTVTPIALVTEFYINVSGGKLEVPVSKTLDEVSYVVLEASHYILVSAVSTNVQDMIDLFLYHKWLYKASPTPPNVVGDFSNTDFNPDFL